MLLRPLNRSLIHAALAHTIGTGGMTKLMFEFGRKILACGETVFESDLGDGNRRVLRELLLGMTESATFKKIHRTGIGELIAKINKGGLWRISAELNGSALYDKLTPRLFDGNFDES